MYQSIIMTDTEQSKSLKMVTTSGSFERNYFNSGKKPLGTKWSPIVDPKNLIVGDMLTWGLSSLVKQFLPGRFQVASMVKPEGNFEYVTGDLHLHAGNFTKS